MKIALFSTCIGDAMFPDASKATALLLARLGHDVVYPKQQTCCGQMHVNTGYQKEAVGQIKSYVEAFSDPSIDYVVAPSGSCVGAVREQHERVAARYGTPALVDGHVGRAERGEPVSVPAGSGHLRGGPQLGGGIDRTHPDRRTSPGPAPRWRGPDARVRPGAFAGCHGPG